MFWVSVRRQRNTEVNEKLFILGTWVSIVLSTSNEELRYRGYLVKLKSYTKSLLTAQKLKLFIKDFFSKCYQIRMETANMVSLTEENLNGKLHLFVQCLL